MVTLCVHFRFGAVYRLFFTSKSDRAAFYSAPSKDFKSVSYPLAVHHI